MKEIDAPPGGFAMNGMWSETGKLVIVPDNRGIAEQLVVQLANYGIKADISRQVDGEASAVLYLSALNRANDALEAMNLSKQAFVTAKAIAPRFEREGGLFVTVQQTGGDFGLRGESGMNAWSSGLAGLMKTMSMEWTKATCKAIDLDHALQDAELCAARIAHELLFGGPELQIGLYADNRRTTLVIKHENKHEHERLEQEDRHVHEYEELDVKHVASHLFSNDIEKPVVVVSGGARGVTAASILSLAKTKRCRFVLLGRTHLAEEPECCRHLDDPSQLRQALIQDDRRRNVKRTPAEIDRQIKHIQAVREIKTTMDELHALGSEAMYIPVDVRDAEEVRRKLAEVRDAWGAIHALVHGSGVLADKRITHKTEAQFDLVFETKVIGLYSLLEATREDRLQAIVLFSSIVAQTGNEGQADYAMANEILNKVAAMEAKERQGNCLVRSINWGPIDGGMVDPSIKKIFMQKQLPLISFEEAADFFVQEMKTPSSDVAEVVICHGSIIEPQWGEMRKKNWTMEVHMHERLQSYLIDHQVRQTVVLPVVQVLEWFMRVSKAIMPNAYRHQLSNLEVKRGVLLSRFKHEGHRLFIHCQIVHHDEACTKLALELRSHHDSNDRSNNGSSDHVSSGDSSREIVHYTAIVEGWNVIGAQHLHMEELRELKRIPAPTEVERIHKLFASDRDRQIERWNWKETSVYDGELLFHGPAFQVIEQACGMTKETVAGMLKSNLAVHWDTEKKEQYMTVPDLLDGGMQISRLWAIQYHELPFLPMKIGRFAMYQPMAQYDELFCVAKCDTIGKLAAKGDIYFYDRDGHIVAEMTGVEGFRVS